MEKQDQPVFAQPTYVDGNSFMRYMEQMRAQTSEIDEQFQNDREASDKKIAEFIVAERTTALAINNKKVSG